MTRGMSYIVMSMPLICVAENGVSPNDIELHDIGTKFYLVEFS